MTKDMPSSSPNTALMKGTRGTSWKLTRTGSPLRSWPRRSAMPSATVRWMTTPGVRVVRIAAGGSGGGGSAAASSAAAGCALGGRIGSGKGSIRRVAHALASQGTRSTAQRRRRGAFIARPRPRLRRGGRWRPRRPPLPLRGRRGRAPAPPPRAGAGTPGPRASCPRWRARRPRSQGRSRRARGRYGEVHTPNGDF